MDYLSKIREALETKGYVPFPGAAIAARGDIWFRHESSTPTVNHVLYLSYKPAARAYGVHVGVFDINARAEVEDRLPGLSGFIEPNYLSSPILMNRPCWHIFDAGRALKWGSLFIIPIPRDPGSWQNLLDSLFSDFLAPVFFSIRDAAGILGLLMRNDPPFEWFLTNPVLRIAEIAALGKVAGVDPKVLRAEVDAYAEISARRIPDGQYSQVVSLIFEQFFNDCR
jgi:hypothetical protein